MYRRALRFPTGSGVLTTAIALGAVAVAQLGLTTACSPPGANRPTGPLRVLEEVASDGGPARCLVVCLPGIGDQPEDYLRHGFVERLRQAKVDADLRLVDAHFGYYRERSVVEHLRAEVLEPAEAVGYEQIWLVGISLGGLGSLALATAEPDRIDGLVLLAPYVGDEAVVARVESSGWPATPAVEGLEEPFDRIWRWLAVPHDDVSVQLAFGAADRFRRGHRLMSRALPDRDVLVGAGGHRWTVWNELWAAIVASGRLQRACGTVRP